MACPNDSEILALTVLAENTSYAPTIGTAILIGARMSVGGVWLGLRSIGRAPEARNYRMKPRCSSAGARFA